MKIMYLEFILTIHTIMVCIYVYNYVNEQNRRERLYQEISIILINRIQEYIKHNIGTKEDILNMIRFGIISTSK